MPSKSTKARVPSIRDLAFATETLLNYHFDDERLCERAIQNGPERKRLAVLPSIPKFGGRCEEDSQCDEEVLRAAYCLGLEVIDEDLLGIEEFKFVKGVSEGPVPESLLVSSGWKWYRYMI